MEFHCAGHNVLGAMTSADRSTSSVEIGTLWAQEWVTRIEMTA